MLRTGDSGDVLESSDAVDKFWFGRGGRVVVQVRDAVVLPSAMPKPRVLGFPIGALQRIRNRATTQRPQSRIYGNSFRDEWHLSENVAYSLVGVRM